jgi:hypothetical protein
MSASSDVLMDLDRDLELDFIREFAAGGESMKGRSADDRRERIRIAIFVHKLAHIRFRDGPMTYAEAYQRCYGRSIEMRRTVRHEPKSEPVIAAVTLQK